MTTEDETLIRELEAQGVIGKGAADALRRARRVSDALGKKRRRLAVAFAMSVLCVVLMSACAAMPDVPRGAHWSAVLFGGLAVVALVVGIASLISLVEDPYS